MSDFVLIDLYSQARAVQQHIQNWTKEEILDWLSFFGRIVIIEDELPIRFVFVPNVNDQLWTPFYFTETDELIIVRRWF
jgi:hypothetical protein